MLKELKSSLQRGPVPPSGSSGCTHVPGSNGPGCPSLVNQMNFAGALHHQHHHHSTVSSSYPVVVIPFGLADRRRQQ
ncbi:unnamed protein product [Linum tenue]|uniref:Uncharacterized protein n=1 Tax=Linum tenue TaxID=586396 RepID=A0AAV0P3P7_9ROSI|nr:unnamed protein product [Linum tenue]